MHSHRECNSKMPLPRKSPPKPPLPVEGWPRPYLRDGVPGLPIEEQEDALLASGLTVDSQHAYIDNLSRAKIRARAPLLERDQAVDPPHPGETVYVASLRVLGWDSLDVMRAMQVAARKNVRVHCLDVGETYSGDMSANELLSALVRSEEARRRARMAPAASASRQTQKRRVAVGLDIAREHWARPPGEISVKEIAKLAGLSTRTLYAKLPPRTQAQEEAVHGKRHT